jgi:hypothetical protein
MSLYLGNDKVKINFDVVKYNLNIFSVAPILNGVMLLSFDDYILRDSNGLYLTAKESE